MYSKYSGIKISLRLWSIGMGFEKLRLILLTMYIGEIVIGK